MDLITPFLVFFVGTALVTAGYLFGARQRQSAIESARSTAFGESAIELATLRERAGAIERHQNELADELAACKSALKEAQELHAAACAQLGRAEERAAGLPSMRQALEAEITRSREIGAQCADLRAQLATANAESDANASKLRESNVVHARIGAELGESREALLRTTNDFATQRQLAASLTNELADARQQHQVSAQAMLLSAENVMDSRQNCVS